MQRHRQRRPQAAAPIPKQEPAKPFKISPEALAYSRIKPAAQKEAIKTVFALPAFPPGVVPDTGGIAQDEALSGTSDWAVSAFGAQNPYGVAAFLGFPALAELAQRPEYRRIAETIATEATRKWIGFTASGDEDKNDKIKKIEAAFKKLRVRDAFRRLSEGDSFMGRSHLFFDFHGTDDAELTTPIGNGADATSRSKIGRGSLKGLKVVEATWCYPSAYNTTNPLAADWYKPSTWYVMGKPVHASRLRPFVAREVPDLLKPAYAFGGLAMSQMVAPYVENWLRTQRNVSDLISSFSVSGVKIDLTALTSGASEEIIRRVEFFTNLRDNRGTMLLDRGGPDRNAEEFFNVSTPLGTLDKLQAQAQEHVASTASVPLVKYTGLQPSGLNATSDGEIRVWYDWILSYQEQFFGPGLDTVLAIVQLSEFGEIDPDISYQFEPLWSLDEKEQAEVDRTRAETDKALVDGKIIAVKESRRRIANEKGTPYAGLDVDETPKPTEAEAVDLAVKRATVIVQAADALLPDDVALKELRRTGLFPSLTDEDIAEAEAEPPAPDMPENAPGEAAGGQTGLETREARETGNGSPEAALAAQRRAA